MFKKKSLGQHFLHTRSYVRAVADAAELRAGERVLEIGPGEGVLTQELLSRGAFVTTVEKDHRLIPVLQEKFSKEVEEGRLTIIEEDALEAEIAMQQPYKVVANIPYYITGALLRKYLEAEAQPTLLVFLVQKEVAERIARSKKESVLSLSIKAFGEPAYVKTVPKGAFVPPPEVDSAILLVKNISRAHFASAEHEKEFFALLHAGFAQKRKLLRRNVEPILGQHTEALMQQADIPLNARAEDVPLHKWLELAK
jgi:16S rRNA (adenine1518-N6/adenine1519-N6)-dimethyltransferase